MKRILLTVALLSGFLATPGIIERASAQAVGMPAVESSVVTWSDVSDYIAAHANHYNVVVELMLRSETVANISTWEESGGQLGWPDSGGQLGWPDRCLSIGFPTRLESQTCAAMIKAMLRN